MALVAVALGRGQRLRRRPGPAVVLPLVEPADERLDVGVAEVAHGLGGEGRADPTGAVDDDRARLVGELALHLELEVAPGQVDGAGDGALLVLVGLPDVEEGDATGLQEGLRVGLLHLADGRLGLVQKISGCGHCSTSVAARAGSDRHRTVKHYQRGQHSRPPVGHPGRARVRERGDTGGRLPAHGAPRGHPPPRHGAELLHRAARAHGRRPHPPGLPPLPHGREHRGHGLGRARGARADLRLLRRHDRRAMAGPLPGTVRRTRPGARGAAGVFVCRTSTSPATANRTSPAPPSARVVSGGPSPTGPETRPSASWRSCSGPSTPGWAPASWGPSGARPNWPPGWECPTDGVSSAPCCSEGPMVGTTDRHPSTARRPLRRSASTGAPGDPARPGRPGRSARPHGIGYAVPIGTEGRDLRRAR